MKAILLAGGFGTRLREETEVKPKPMVEIGGRPILWHIMKTYAHYGFQDFILCLGYKGQRIKEYFLNYKFLNSDFTIELATQDIELLNGHGEGNWRVSLVDTGLEAMTGARVKRVQPYLDGETFMLTYGDGVTNLNIQDLLRFHESHGKIGTVTAVSPLSRYGELAIDGDQVISFQEKPRGQHAYISGGYFVFNRAFFEYLSDDDKCVLERRPLEQLTIDGQLKVYEHKGFWQCMDTARDYDYLKELWNQAHVPWKVWDD